MIRLSTLVLAIAVAFPLSARAKPKAAPRSVGILVMDGIFNTELIGPYDVFDHAKGFKVFTVAPQKRTLTSAEGLRFEPDHDFETAPAIDVLVIPSFEDYEKHLEQRALIGWIRRTAKKADWVLSHCWGAFYLAQAGLLDEKTATTWPSDNDRFQRRFPKVKVKSGYRFVRHGNVITSAGGVASFESPLYLVRTLDGDEAAKRVAKGLVIPDALQAKLPHLVTP